MVFYQSEYQKIYLIENNIIIQEWLEKTKMLKEDQFKNEMIKLRENIINQPNKLKLLIDMRNFFFVVAPELQNWVNKEINDKIKEKVEKTAFVVSPDLFTKVSVEQTLEESRGLNLQYFEDYDKALNWLKTK